MKIEITNRQKIKRINLKGLRKKLIKVGAQNFSSLRGISAKKISILLCDNKFITSLNRRYFKKSCPTDVIAFPLEDNLEPDYLSCIELGGVPIGVLVADRTGLPLIIIRKEAKDHGIKGRLIGDFEKGKTVLLLEDVTTTGGSVANAIKALKDEGLHVETIITVVDRQEGAEETISGMGITLISLTTATDILRDDHITNHLKDIDAIKDRDKEILLMSNKLTSNKESYEDDKKRYEELREIKRREDKKNK